ncbi:hypothetical protein C8Q77DRAFT_903795 [Trametes polyzona]|nr:hypothetical protein C8Q77DRAFT_903795 [Trametes polyzona]
MPDIAATVASTQRPISVLVCHVLHRQLPAQRLITTGPDRYRSRNPSVARAGAHYPCGSTDFVCALARPWLARPRLLTSGHLSLFPPYHTGPYQGAATVCSEAPRGSSSGPSPATRSINLPLVVPVCICFHAHDCSPDPKLATTVRFVDVRYAGRSIMIRVMALLVSRRGVSALSTPGCTGLSKSCAHPRNNLLPIRRTRTYLPPPSKNWPDQPD